MLQRTEYNTNINPYTIDVDVNKTILNNPTGNFFYDPWIIKDEYRGTVWEELLDSLSVDKGEARVIRMNPGTTYMAHADIDDRWHLNLQGEQSYLIDLNNEEMHLLEQDGYWYNMDAGRIHIATNFGPIDRLQVVVRQLLKWSNKDSLINITIEPSNPQHDYRYKFDNIISPWLNIVNKRGNLADFRVEGEVVKFKTTKKELLDLNLTENFKMTVE